MLKERRAYKLNYLGERSSQSESKGLISKPGDLIIIKRGVFRSLILKCPCACGDDLVFNLDPRIDKAWRLYIRKKKITVFPSIWRDNGCESHFIIWNSNIHWCDYHSLWDEYFDDEALSRRIIKDLQYKNLYYYVDLAEKLNAIPWEVLDACRQLVKKGVLIEGQQEKSGYFTKNKLISN